jgi:hypothetical protein
MADHETAANNVRCHINCIRAPPLPSSLQEMRQRCARTIAHGALHAEP